jgi:ribosomal protein S18 acetylase RimI-like enzyme
MKIRDATINDYHSIFKLFSQSDHFHYENESCIGHESKANCRSLEYIQELIEQENAIFLVLEQENGIIGFIYGYQEEKGYLSIYNPRKYLYIDNLVIDENEQNKGYGTILLKKMIETAKDRKYKDIVLNVYTFNTKAIQLYEKFGFKIISQDMILKM